MADIIIGTIAAIIGFCVAGAAIIGIITLYKGAKGVWKEMDSK